MKFFVKTTLSFLITLFSLNVEAVAYKCSDSNGAITFSTSPCLASQNEVRSSAVDSIKIQEAYLYAHPEAKEARIKEAQRMDAEHQRIYAPSKSYVNSKNYNSGHSMQQMEDHMEDQMDELQGQMAAQQGLMQGQMAAQKAQMEAQMRHEASKIQNQERSRNLFR